MGMRLLNTHGGIMTAQDPRPGISIFLPLPDSDDAATVTNDESRVMGEYVTGLPGKIVFLTFRVVETDVSEHGFSR